MTANDLRDAAKDTVASAKDAADRAADAASGSSATMADKANAAVDRMKDAVGATYDNVREQMPGSAGDAVDAGRRAYAQGSDRIGRQVARQPIEALLLAGAIGYLVGWAANRS